MADITMCSSPNCPQYDFCYRAQAPINMEGQSWANFEYTCNESNGFCEFIPQKMSDNLTKSNKK